MTRAHTPRAHVFLLWHILINPAGGKLLNRIRDTRPSLWLMPWILNARETP
jgi:hypothetical protein